MDEIDLKRAGQTFRVGEDLYGISITQLTERLEILAAEHVRVKQAITHKNEELTTAETFFQKS